MKPSHGSITFTEVMAHTASFVFDGMPHRAPSGSLQNWGWLGNMFMHSSALSLLPMGAQLHLVSCTHLVAQSCSSLQVFITSRTKKSSALYIHPVSPSQDVLVSAVINLSPISLMEESASPPAPKRSDTIAHAVAKPAASLLKRSLRHCASASPDFSMEASAQVYDFPLVVKGPLSAVVPVVKQCLNFLGGVASEDELLPPELLPPLLAPPPPPPPAPPPPPEAFFFFTQLPE
mmetsp:Transcript_25205/g.63429  ORF Transcript_25205/g.63429 Transcript_25205/m.63429 type:complete len:233 (+) Transcript_25205:5060-5758(+)